MIEATKNDIGRRVRYIGEHPRFSLDQLMGKKGTIVAVYPSSRSIFVKFGPGSGWDFEAPYYPENLEWLENSIL